MAESLFMQDSWHSNHGYEAMLDFQISWLMRLAAEKEVEKPRLHEVSKDVLLRLVGKTGNKNIEIKKVEVWRQWASIDVVAEVNLIVDGKPEQHLVVIEDKAYTMLHDDQLVRYKKVVSEAYEGKRDIHYWVITFFDKSEKDKKKYDTLKQDCDDAGWRLLSFYEVIDWNEDFESTGSDLFDEFWLKTWY